MYSLTALYLYIIENIMKVLFLVAAVCLMTFAPAAEAGAKVI